MALSETEATSLPLQAIGYLRSPFTEKFGIPRQANLIQSAQAEVELCSPFNTPDAVAGLEDFSHIWLTFGFHLNTSDKWRPMIRPPRLGGNKKVGVFASRSPFRPNNLGQSLVELRKVVIEKQKARLIIACPDLLDGTPVYDIKPYIHYADSNDQAKCAFADEQPLSVLTVTASETFISSLSTFKGYPDDLEALIREVISYDPRPAYKKNKIDNKTYKLKLYDLDVSFKVIDNNALLTDIRKAV